MEAVKFGVWFVWHEGASNQSRYEIEKSTLEASMPGVFNLAGVFEDIKDMFDNGTLAQQQFVKQRHWSVYHILLDFGNQLNSSLEKGVEDVSREVSLVSNDLAVQGSGEVFDKRKIDAADITGGNDNAQELSSSLITGWTLKPKSYPAEVLPRLANPLNTLCLAICLLWQTAILVESMNDMPVLLPSREMRK